MLNEGRESDMFNFIVGCFLIFGLYQCFNLVWTYDLKCQYREVATVVQYDSAGGYMEPVSHYTTLEWVGGGVTTIKGVYKSGQSVCTHKEWIREGE